MKYIYLTILLLLYAVVHVYSEENIKELEENDSNVEIKSNELNNARESRQYNGNFRRNNRRNVNNGKYPGLTRNKQQYFYVATTNIPRDVLEEDDLEAPMPSIRIADNPNDSNSMVTSYDPNENTLTGIANDYSVKNIDDDDDDDDDDQPEGRRLGRNRNSNRRLRKRFQKFRRMSQLRERQQRLKQRRRRRRLRKQQKKLKRRQRRPNRRRRNRNRRIQESLKKKSKKQRRKLRAKLEANRRLARRQLRKKKLQQKRRLKRLKRKQQRNKRREDKRRQLSHSDGYPEYNGNGYAGQNNGYIGHNNGYTGQSGLYIN